MSINYCTISGSSIDSFCSGRRTIVLNRLITELHPQPVPLPNINSIRGGGPTLRFQHQSRQWEQPTIVLPTELDRVTVSVTASFSMGGAPVLSGTDFQDIMQQLDLVTVTNIEIEPVTISVNISSLKVN